ncbi:MAG: shikimate kinase AroL [Gemmataceae bacterium]
MSDSLRDRRLIFLVGGRGSGKSTVGQLLAAHLRWQFVDADVMMEAQAGRTIAAIFASEGEAGFRNREAALLNDLAKRFDSVIATGGGVVLRPDNRIRLRESGICIWLAADPQVLWERIEADPITAARRPALTKLPGLAEVERLLREREPLYREVAHLTVDGSQSPDGAVSSILSAWRSL